MATQPETMEFILEKLGEPGVFSTRPMFGEYALYANGKTVAFICDDLLYVKILPASSALETLCEKGEAYPGSKPYYVVDESQLTTIEQLPDILIALSNSLPAKKKSAKKGAAKKRA